MDTPLISVVVASYNSDLIKLKKTIISALLQEGISFEVIVTDDGSGDNHFEELRAFFAACGFKDYQLIAHEKNQGTVANVYDGLVHAKGKYAKLISGGDYLYSKTCLKETADYMEKYSIKACFSDAVYYEPSEELKIIETTSNPMLKSLYRPENYNDKDCYLDYLAMQDGALGAAFLTETELLKTYLSKALGKLILFEDFTYAYMMYCGERVYYYPQPTVWYEYGTGVSTAEGDRKQRLFEREFSGLKELILNTEIKEPKAYEKIYRDMLKDMPYKSRKEALIKRFLMHPGLIRFKLKSMTAAEKTPGPELVNTDFFELINREAEYGN